MATERDASAATGQGVLNLIGNTPLLRFEKLARAFPGVEICGKAEWTNPGGSVKDRPALWMILEGEQSGRLRPDKTILDATSGNTGIAYAMIGAARGYRVKLCVPENVTPERKRILRAYGAELVLTDPMEGSDGAIREVRRIYELDRERYYYPDQYSNPVNWQAHYNTTGPELMAQTNGAITHFVAGLGTSGTFMGTGRYLREHKPSITLVSVQPETALHGLEGMKHMASALVPGIYDRSLADDEVEVSTLDAQEMTRQLARKDGLLVGVSAGANVHAALAVAASSPAGSVVVTVLCDAGGRYLGDSFWDEPR